MTKSIKLVLASLVTSQLNQFTLAALLEDASVPGVHASLVDGSEKVTTEGADAATPLVKVVTGKFIGGIGKDPHMLPGHIGIHEHNMVLGHIGIHENNLVHDDFGMHDFGHHEVHDHYDHYDHYAPHEHYDHYDPYHRHASDVRPGLLTHAAENLEGGWGTFKHVLAHWTRNMGSTMNKLGYGLHRAGQEAHAMSHVGGYAHDHYDYPYAHADPYDSYDHVDSHDHYAHDDPYAHAAYHGAYSPFVHAASHYPAHASIVYGSAAQTQAQVEEVQPDVKPSRK